MSRVGHGEGRKTRPADGARPRRPDRPPVPCGQREFDPGGPARLGRYARDSAASSVGTRPDAAAEFGHRSTAVGRPAARELRELAAAADSEPAADPRSAEVNLRPRLRSEAE